jgi:hypothetical protein
LIDRTVLLLVGIGLFYMVVVSSPAQVCREERSGPYLLASSLEAMLIYAGGESIIARATARIHAAIKNIQVWLGGLISTFPISKHRVPEGWARKYHHPKVGLVDHFI